MLLQIISFLLNVIAGLLGGACLLRLYMQYQHIPFGNPVGRFVFALSDWIVLPLRRVLPKTRKFDLSSLIGAYLIELAKFGILWLLAGRLNAGVVPLLALFGLLELAVSGMVGLVIIYAILSWVQADSPIVDVIDRLCAPLLRPFRRMIPLVGGFDLSPLALLVVLQICTFVLQGVQDAVLR
jgi:YggT family protein